MQNESLSRWILFQCLRISLEIFSERPYPDFSSTSYGRTMWGQSSAEPCRTVPNKVRQQCMVTTYGNNVRQKRTAIFRRQYLGNGLSDLHETLTVLGPHLCSKSVKF